MRNGNCIYPVNLLLLSNEKRKIKIRIRPNWPRGWATCSTWNGNLWNHNLMRQTTFRKYIRDIQDLPEPLKWEYFTYFFSNLIADVRSINFHKITRRQILILKCDRLWRNGCVHYCVVQGSKQAQSHVVMRSTLRVVRNLLTCWLKPNSIANRDLPYIAPM